MPSNDERKARGPVVPRIPRAIFEYKLRPTEFVVWAKLWSHAGGSDHVAWPSGATIARDCRIHIDSVWPALKTLEALGLLKRHRSPNSNRYHMVVPTAPPPENFGREKAWGVTGNEGVTLLETEGCGYWKGRGLDVLERKGFEGIPLKVATAKNSASTPSFGRGCREGGAGLVEPVEWTSEVGPIYRDRDWTDLTEAEQEDVWTIRLQMHVEAWRQLTPNEQARLIALDAERRRPTAA